MDQIVVDPLLLGALTTLVAIAAAGLGLFLGWRRPRAQDMARIAELEAELAAARTSAESRKGDIDEHFEASAALFGKLARDYRALFEHWADSATKLGVSEARAAAIVDQARARLLEDARTLDPERDTEETSAPAGDGQDSMGTEAEGSVEADADGAGESASAAPDASGATPDDAAEAPSRQPR